MATAQIPLSKIMKKSPKICLPEMKLSEIAPIMLRENCGCLPVVASLEGMIPVGVITDRDIVCRSIAKGLNPMNLLVKDCMTRGCHTIDSAATLSMADRMMDSKKIRRLIVVDKNGKCCGVISKVDIAEYFGRTKVIKTPRAPKVSKRVVTHRMWSKAKGSAKPRAHA